VRTTIVIIALFTTVFAFAQAGVAPDSLLERGMSSYRSGNYQAAVDDLQAASQAYLSPQQMQNYVNTGEFENLGRFETSLIYLALAQSRLGRENEARDTILRLMTAERIEPSYASLSLEADAAEFETLTARLVPNANLPANVQLARGGATPVPPAITTPAAEPTLVIAEAPTTALPPVQVAEAPAPVVIETPETSQTSSAPAPIIATTGPTTEPAIPAATLALDDTKRVVQPTIAAEKEERQRIVDFLVAQEREKIMKEAELRLAEVQRQADQRVAEAQAAAQRDAETRIAEQQRQAEARLAEQQRAAEAQLAEERRTAEARIAEQQRAADARIAEQERALQARLDQERRDAETRLAAEQRAAETRLAEERAAAQRAAQQMVADANAATRRNYLASLRQAEAFVSNEQLPQANDIYQRVANSENAPREIIAEAAIGLYRTGSFRNAVNAFRRLGTFAKGEEDLRYYNAVSLYETGAYAEAKKELSCALPFIEVTDDVSRYRAKIEQTAAQAASR
jgi:hypothetical protein